jgi:hypothetical protein
MYEEIKLTDVIKIDEPSKFKLHLGSRNEDGEHPLDYFAENPKNWRDWNEWKGNRNDWTRDYIFSLIEFYPKANTWLFGGVFKVNKRLDDKYEIEECVEYSKYTGRLILSFHRYQGLRGRAFNLESFINDFTVSEMLPEIYAGEIFPGYDNINHDFNIIESIIKKEKIDWKTALQNVKGIYLVTDKSNGKSYVGSAYGDSGIWSRWQCYIGTGHGGNDQLIELIAEKGLDYAKANFKIALLEILSMTSSDDFVISREKRWKSILMTKEHGYNSN